MIMVTIARLSVGSRRWWINVSTGVLEISERPKSPERS